MIENLVRGAGEVFNAKVNSVPLGTGFLISVVPTHQAVYSSTSPLVIRWKDGSVSTVTASTVTLTVDGTTDTFGYNLVSTVVFDLHLVKNSGGTVYLVLGKDVRSSKVASDVANKHDSICASASFTISQVSNKLCSFELTKHAGGWSVVSVG